MWKWLVVLAVLLGGCAAPIKPAHVMEFSRLADTGTEYGSDATVYIFREGDFSGGAWSVEVLVDGVSRTTLRTKTYASFPVTPGNREIRFHWKAMIGTQTPDIAIVGDVTAGNTYYFSFGADTRLARNDPDYELQWKYSSLVRQIDRQAAESRKAAFEKRDAQ